MMSAVIRQETVVFLLSVLHGAGLAFCYDLIRALRRAFRHGDAMVSAEDFLFWLAAGFLTFCLVFSRTDGVVRGYVAAGILIGVVLYHFSVSDGIVRLFSRGFLLIKRIFCIMMGVVSWPAKNICRFWKKTIEIAGKNGYNKFKKKLRGNCDGRKKTKAQQQ